MFFGFTGFRFPFAHFPSHTASGQELYLLLWKSVNMLSSYGFTIQYASTDGFSFPPLVINKYALVIVFDE
jgi:hypothetical protein